VDKIEMLFANKTKSIKIQQPLAQSIQNFRKLYQNVFKQQQFGHVWSRFIAEIQTL
jgi:hypothetical protein